MMQLFVRLATYTTLHSAVDIPNNNREKTRFSFLMQVCLAHPSSCRCVLRTPRPYRSEASNGPIRNDGWTNSERWCIRHMMTQGHCAFFSDVSGALEGPENYGNTG